MEGLGDVFRCMRSLVAVTTGLGEVRKPPCVTLKLRAGCPAEHSVPMALLCSLVLQQRDAKAANVHLNQGELWRQGRRKGKAQLV